MSNNPAIDSNNIEILGPYELDKLLYLKIVKKINEHAKIFFVGVIPKTKKDSYIKFTQPKVEVNQVDYKSNKTKLFNGYVTNVSIEMVRDIYYLCVEGVSYTYDMDVKFKKRSFQNKDMPYTGLIDEVKAGYKGADYIDKAAHGNKLEKFIIQYNETDWEFLKRMASHFFTGLVPDATANKPKFWFGVPDGSEVKLIDNYYSVKKKISDYRFSSENYNPDLDEKDFTYYEVEIDKYLNIGDKVSFKGMSFNVSEVTSVMKEGVLRHECVLAPKKGLSQNLILNNKAAGISVEGKVIDIENDNIRIHLTEIDEKQSKDEAYWFPYSTFYTTEGQTGWYCMPELEDRVKLYFPTNKEEEGIVMNSIRRRVKGGDTIKNPKVKFFRTKYGKELMFTEDEIMITGKDDEVLIRLIKDKGIEIYSKKDIRVKADEKVKIEAGKTVQISAGDGIGIKCKESLIEMDGITTIKGTQVKTN